MTTTRPQDIIARIAKVNLKDTSKILRALMVYSRWSGEDSVSSLLRAGTQLKPDIVSTFHFRPNEHDVASCTESFNRMMEDLQAKNAVELIDDLRNANYKTYFFSVNGGDGHTTQDDDTYPPIIGVISGSVRESEEFLHLLPEASDIKFEWQMNHRRES
jgi:hypothetical protein